MNPLIDFDAVERMPWKLPEPLTEAELQRLADEYQRDAIADADDDEPAEDLG